MADNKLSGHGKKRVFLADDHVLVREGLAALLEKTDRFEVAGQCGDGLLVVSQVLAAAPDAVVLDITMPGLNGLDICRELTQRLPGAPVLILSVHSTEEFIIRAIEYGARGYLLKESAASDLVEAVATVLAGGIYLGPGIDKRVLLRVNEPRVDPYDRLTNRERQVLQLVAEGMTNPMIAARLGLSPRTVDVHRTRLMKKLDIHDQTTLVKFFWTRNGGLNAAVLPGAAAPPA